MERLGGGHALLLYPEGVAPTNTPTISHLSRALRFILRFQEQLRHFLGSTAEQNTLTLCPLDIQLLHSDDGHVQHHGAGWA